MLNRVELMLLCATACCFSISFVDVPFREELLELSGCTGQEFWRSYSKNKSNLAGCMVGVCYLKFLQLQGLLEVRFKDSKLTAPLFLGNGKWHWMFFTQDKIVTAHPAVVNELTCKIIDRSNIDRRKFDYWEGDWDSCWFCPRYHQEIFWPRTSQKCGQWNSFWVS